MARKYTRDNRGRFASKGTGATSRGGRLRTAAGNKRATQTMQVKGSRAGTIGKPKGLKPDASMSSRLKMRDSNSALGKFAQRKAFKASMQRAAAGVTGVPSKPRTKAGRPSNVMKGTERMNARAFVTKAGQNKAARAQSKSLRAKPAKPATKATSKLRPGELINANARPVNTMARFKKGENPFMRGSGQTTDNRAARLANVKTAIKMVQARGINAVAYSGNQKTQARARGNRQVEVNRASRGWENPAKTAINQRRSGFWSSSSPMAVVQHEIGHIRDKGAAKRQTRFGESWSLANRETSMDRQLARGRDMSRLARRVSRYATYSPSEFIAETYAGLRTGRRYDYQVMRAYREAQGLSPTPAARRRRRKPR